MNRYQEILSQAQDNLETYKKDFYEMSVGSLRAIMQNSQNILN